MSGDRGLVLVLHSDATLRGAWVDALSGGGWSTVGVGDPAHALALIARKRVRIVCVGGSPDGRGASDLLRTIADAHPAVSRVLLAQRTDSPVAVECLREGAASAVVLDSPERVRLLATIDWRLAMGGGDGSPDDVVAALEHDHPGLRKVTREEDGTYRLEELRAAVVLDRLARAAERFRSTLPPAAGSVTPEAELDDG